MSSVAAIMQQIFFNRCRAVMSGNSKAGKSSVNSLHADNPRYQWLYKRPPLPKRTQHYFDAEQVGTFMSVIYWFCWEYFATRTYLSIMNFDLGFSYPCALFSKGKVKHQIVLARSSECKDERFFLEISKMLHLRNWDYWEDIFLHCSHFLAFLH